MLGRRLGFAFCPHRVSHSSGNVIVGMKINQGNHNYAYFKDETFLLRFPFRLICLSVVSVHANIPSLLQFAC